MPWTMLLVLILLATNGYFLILRPRLRRRPLLAAIPLLDSDLRQDLESAEEQLVEALTAGLGHRDILDTRFALALARAKLGRFDPAKYTEAVATLGNPETAWQRDPATAHLYLWLQAQLGKHDAVLALADHPGRQLGDRHQTTEIYGVSLVRKAVEHWSRREVEGALHYIDRVPSLDSVRGVAPPELVELLLEHGMRAVFDRRYEVARKSFTDARQRAEAVSVPEIEARLGLLVCDWHEEDRHELAGPLGAVLDELDQRGRKRGENGDDVRLLRAHVGWWYVVAMLEEWLVRVPVGSPLPSAEYERFLKAVRVVETADPELGDVAMIHGLLDHGLATDDELRARAVGVLDRAARTGKAVVLPEVLDLVARERESDDDKRRADLDSALNGLAGSRAVESWARGEFGVRPGPPGDWGFPLPDGDARDSTPSVARMMAVAHALARRASAEEASAELVRRLADFAEAEKNVERARREVISSTSRLVLREEQGSSPDVRP